MLFYAPYFAPLTYSDSSYQAFFMLIFFFKMKYHNHQFIANIYKSLKFFIAYAPKNKELKKYK